MSQRDFLIEAVKALDREVTDEIRNRLFATMLTLDPSTKGIIGTEEKQQKMFTGFIR